MLVAMVVLPTPPLGEKTPMTRPFGAFGLLDGCGPAPARVGLAGPLQQHPDLGRIRLRAEDVPDAGAHGEQDKGRVRLADQDDAELRQLHIEDRGEPQGILHRDVRPQDEHLGALLVEVREQLAGVRRVDEREGLQPAREPAGQGLPDAGVEVGVRGDQDKAAHL